MLDRAPRRSMFYLPLLCLPLLWTSTFHFPLDYRGNSQVKTQLADHSYSLNLVENRASLDRANKSSNAGVVLLAQYTGPNSHNNTYAALLNLTRPMNQVYASLWGYDYLLASGYMIQSDVAAMSSHLETVDKINTSMPFVAKAPESRATYNKVMILDRVLSDSRFSSYDSLVLLDADALVYDFAHDVVATLLPSDKIFVALQVDPKDPTTSSPSTANVNIGVTIWNLRHPMTTMLVRVWKNECLKRIRRYPRVRDSDQAPLHKILYDMTPDQRNRFVVALSDHELGYRKGRYIKHFIRPNADNWTDASETMAKRLAQVHTAIDEICHETFTLANHPTECADSYVGRGE